MSRFRSLGLVAGRELREAVRRRSMWVVVGLLLVGSSAAMVVPELLSSNGTTRYDVAVVGEAPTLVRALRTTEAGLDAQLDITTADDPTEARRRVEDEAADIAVVPGRDAAVIARADENEALVGAARQALAQTELAQRLGEAGLSPAETRTALDTPTPRLTEVDVETRSRRTASFVVSLVLYILLLTLMVQVANGVAVEKANRISEVLLAIVRPGSLLFGKVIGVGLTGLGVLAAALIPAVTKFALGGDLPEGIGGALTGGAAWFALGLALYLTIAGALGALVERQEEAGAVVSPLTFLLIGTFVLTQGGADSPLGTVLAYIPVTSPLMVPTRVAIGVASPFELVTSLVILVATIALAARVAATIYGRAVVRTGRRLKLREVLKPA